MGTTATTNLALIKPDTAEEIRQNLPTFVGWAAQNASNCDKLDGLFRADTFTYTPNWIGSTTNPVLGTGGYVEGKYVRLFPRLVYGFVRIFAGGAGFSAGTGSIYSVSLPPVAMDASLTGFNSEMSVGRGAYFDVSSIADNTAMETMYSTISNAFFMRTPTLNVWSPTAPTAMAQNDRVSFYFKYPTAAA